MTVPPLPVAYVTREAAPWVVWPTAAVLAACVSWWAATATAAAYLAMVTYCARVDARRARNYWDHTEEQPCR